MTLAVIPMVYNLRMKRWHMTVVVCMIIWVAGGAAPRLVPNNLMGATQRLNHMVEIFTQTFSLGVTAVFLLRPKSAPLTANPSVPPTVPV